MPNGYNHSGSPSVVLGLHPRRIGQDVPVRENLVMAQMFLNLFIKVQGNYPATDFRPPDWVHPTQNPWWRDLTLFVLNHFDVDLKKLGLHKVVRTTCHGIEISVPNSFAIFEL